MQFSPYLLLRHPTYDLSRLDVFAIHPNESDTLEDAIEKRRKHFLSFITSKDLLLSLPFSSKTVYQAIPHYEFHAAVKIRKKEKQTERALMKYLSRMSLNPSPLAAFAKSQFADWEWNVIPPANKYELSLSLTQRKEFFDLCYCDVGLQKFMRYRLNPSLRKHAQGFTYLHRDGEGESRVELESDQQFEAMFDNMLKSDFTFEQFVVQTNYDVNDFLEAQLIVPSYPTYGEHEMIARLVEDINERHELNFKVEDIVGIYKDELSDKYALDQQKHWESQLLAFAKKLEVGLDHKLYSERTYYLNTYSTENFNNPAFDKVSLTNEVMALVDLAIQSKKSHENISIHWDTVYDSPIHIEQEFDVSAIPTNRKSEFILQLNVENKAEAEKYNALGIMLRFSDQDLPRLINVSTPFGKFFAPALELVSESLKEDFKHWVQETSQSALVLKDSSLHNKNRAHGFLPELNNFGLNFHSPISERKFVDFSKEGTLVDIETKEPVLAVNLGIEEYSSRSAYYQNLYLQSNILPNLPNFITAIQNQNRIKMDEHVSSAPKLITEHLVLAYRKWYAAKTAFESFLETKQVNLEALNIWRKKYKIPRIVEYNIDNGKSFYLDFFNPWSVDNFLKLIKKMEINCVLEDIGFKEEINDKRLYEAYFEVKCK